LDSYSEDLSHGAKERLEKLGIEVRLGEGVDEIDADGVIVAGERITSKTVIWTAGVAPSPAGKWLNAETDRAGRVRVQPDLSVPGFPEIFAVGDTAALDQDGRPLGGVAQVAMQQGRYVGVAIHRRVHGGSPPRPFRYFDKGTMAVVGPGYAVMQSGKVHMKGPFAWIIWAVIHILSLAQPGLRISVFVQWMWTLLAHQPGSRLIVNYRTPAGETPVSGAGAEVEQMLGQSSRR
jgi:NADH dehydrogenase FAD-containing subunit